MSNFLIPRSTQILLEKEREKMLNNVVRMIGRMGEEVSKNMIGDSRADEVIEVCEEPGNTVSYVDKAVEKALDGRLKSLLHDVDYRISVLQDLLARAGVGPKDGDRIVSSDLNVAHHILDGYTFTDNSPVAGSIAWAGCHIVYKGTDYTITDGDTNAKYVWWDFDAQPNTVFQTSATKPTLTADDVLVAINDNGTARVVLVPGKMLPGGALLDGAISTNELADGAVDSNKLAALAVLEGNIAAGAVTNAKLGNAAVDDTKLANGAVVAGKIAAGGISASNQFVAGVVDNSALASNAVTNAKISDGAVTNTKIGAGAVAANKLNIATHMLYALPIGLLLGGFSALLLQRL